LPYIALTDNLRCYKYYKLWLPVDLILSIAVLFLNMHPNWRTQRMPEIITVERCLLSLIEEQKLRFKAIQDSFL